jgi:hypothetical protein
MHDRASAALDVAHLADVDEQFRAASCAIETVDDMGAADARISQRRMRDLRKGAMTVVMIVFGMRKHDRRRERVALQQLPETSAAFPVASDARSCSSPSWVALGRRGEASGAIGAL